VSPFPPTPTPQHPPTPPTQTFVTSFSFLLFSPFFSELRGPDLVIFTGSPFEFQLPVVGGDAGGFHSPDPFSARLTTPFFPFRSQMYSEPLRPPLPMVAPSLIFLIKTFVQSFRYQVLYRHIAKMFRVTAFTPLNSPLFAPHLSHSLSLPGFRRRGRSIVHPFEARCTR